MPENGWQLFKLKILLHYSLQKEAKTAPVGTEPDNLTSAVEYAVFTQWNITTGFPPIPLPPSGGQTIWIKSLVTQCWMMKAHLQYDDFIQKWRVCKVSTSSATPLHWTLTVSWISEPHITKYSWRSCMADVLKASCNISQATCASLCFAQLPCTAACSLVHYSSHSSCHVVTWSPMSWYRCTYTWCPRESNKWSVKWPYAQESLPHFMLF